jgi:hypothetical protein
MRRLGVHGWAKQGLGHNNVTTSAEDHRGVPVGSVQGEAEAAKMLGDAVKNNPGETSSTRAPRFPWCARAMQHTVPVQPVVYYSLQ